ncbi:C1 family peptidase [Kribbella sp. NPDC051718]|uniref:C1 family peptidase n=1 Tax=Kribbella sp. NPDC051718 TaxID=3155168 RepID=UPI003425A34D
MAELNLAALQTALDASTADWQPSRNPISDLPLDEFRKRLGYVPGPHEPTLDDRELASELNLAAASVLGRSVLSPGAAAVAAVAAALPAKVDLRDIDGKSYITPIRDQHNCGSCVAFGVIAAVEGTLKYALRDADLDIDLSEAQLFYCHARAEGRNCSNGWWADRALEAFRRLGVADEGCYPYTDVDQNCTGLCGDSDGRLTFIDGWRRFVTPASMKNWLTSEGPLVACFSVYDDFRFVGSSVYRHVAGEFLGGHCVCIIGYDDNAGCWIAKNSWGPAWGDQGFFRIAYGNVGIDAEMWTIEGVRPPAAPLDAHFVSQRVPSAATPGQPVQASVTMRNTGIQTWTRGRAFRLGSQAPQDNLTWGTGRVELPHDVPPWSEVTFAIPLTTPAQLPAHLQWRMLQEHVTWFGDFTPEVVVPPAAAALRFGSVIKLRHLLSGRALHSHLFDYGHPGSSGQQQVTCYEKSDANDLWRLRGPDGSADADYAGRPIQHGDVLRFTHVQTRRNLHSHAGFPSPVTGQQEVTCFGADGAGDGNDDWRVEVAGGGAWTTDKQLRLIHVLTDHALHSHLGYSDPQWTMGQQEVTGFAERDDNDYWFATDLAERDAVFLSQAAPATLIVNEQRNVEVTMRNVGLGTWVPGSYRLGSQQPQDNTIWGLGRVELAAPVASGEETTFRFQITAPATPGRAYFRWQMLEEGVQWFGEQSVPIAVDVFTGAGQVAVPDVVGEVRAVAGAKLRAAELKARYVGVASPAAEVRAQNPAPGVQVARGSVVTLQMGRLIVP